jgi:hypothetical protein
LKKGKQKEETQPFDAEKIFGGKDAADLQKQGGDDIGLFVGAQGFEREAEGEQVKKKWDEFLIDMRQRHPMLTVAGENQHEQSSKEGECFAIGEDLVEGPPSRDADEKADDEREDLPREWMGWNEAGGEYEDGTEKRAKGHEGGDELSGTEKFCNPCEGPVVPIEAGEGQQQPIGADGEDGDEQSLTAGGGAKRHPSIIRDCEGRDVLIGCEECLKEWGKNLLPPRAQRAQRKKQKESLCSSCAPW